MSDDQTVEIAPCPCCGGECHVLPFWPRGAQISCRHCSYLSRMSATAAAAIAAHNALCADVQRGREAAKIEQERDALRAEVERLRGVANIAAAIVRALLGAMPPSLQRKWPTTVSRASAFVREVNVRAALDTGQGEAPKP